jgi:ubiquinol-cytochrome c reductase cytochrome c1 subunit
VVRMNRLIVLLAGLMAVPAVGLAAGGSHYPLDHANVNLSNKAALQRGAKYFVNYCMGCHSAQYSRYQRVGKDLGLTEDQVEDNLILTTDDYGDRKKPGDLMTITMTKDYADDAFGKAPPDLSLVARVRGANWLYTFLRSFYLDGSRQTGVNNAVFPNTAMPHVLWELQGFQEPEFETHQGPDGHEHKKLVGLELAEEGTLSPAEYDKAVLDLVTFLVYLGEPIKQDRQGLGVWVIGYLLVMLVVFYLLKKEYWKDVH